MRLLATLLIISFIAACSKNVNTLKQDNSCIDQSSAYNPRDCEYEYEPVCSCNQATYRNSCFAKAAGVKSWKKGICEGMCIDPTVVISDQICYRESAPVCGCDGKTYINSCFARKKGVLSFTDGECGTTDAK